MDCTLPKTHASRINRSWLFWQHDEKGQIKGIKSKLDFNVLTETARISEIYCYDDNLGNSNMLALIGKYQFRIYDHLFWFTSREVHIFHFQKHLHS